MVWHVDPARPREPRLLAFNIGLTAWETVLITRPQSSPAALHAAGTTEGCSPRFTGYAHAAAAG